MFLLRQRSRSGEFAPRTSPRSGRRSRIALEPLENRALLSPLARPTTPTFNEGVGDVNDIVNVPALVAPVRVELADQVEIELDLDLDLITAPPTPTPATVIVDLGTQGPQG